MDKNETKSFKEKPIIGITIGDINGVGPEVIIKALADNRILKLATPVIYGSTKVLSFYKKLLNIEEFVYNQIKGFENFSHKKVNVINCWEEHIEVKVGEVTSDGGKCAFWAIKKATEDLKEGHINAVITAPINKSNIQGEEFNFPGHTEYFTHSFNAAESLMLMVNEELRIGVVTGHIPLSEVSRTLTKELLSNKIHIFLETLKKDFGIIKPKLAVLGLNPHAGEEGLLGKEEQDIIKPVIEELRSKGKLVMGPFSADGFFGAKQYNKFDGILAMYHDQGLIPFKALSFESGVNYTAGLPFIRTSPDHGTAYSLAGKNIASEASLREAIFLACHILKNHEVMVD